MRVSASGSVTLSRHLPGASMRKVVFNRAILKSLGSLASVTLFLRVVSFPTCPVSKCLSRA